MGLFASLRNAVQWAGFDLGRTDGASAQAVVMIDPATNLPVSPTNVTLTGPITVSNEVEIKNDVGSPVPMSVSVLPLPSGAATAANQTTANTSLANIDADIGAQADAAFTGTGNTSVIGALKGVFARLLRGQQTSANSLSVAPASDATFTVSGAAAAGSAPTSAPLSVSGVDAGGLKRHILTDTAGNQAIFAAVRSCVGRQTITALSSSTPATLTVPGGAVAAMIQADGGQVRVTLDGSTNPTATVGQRVDDGVFFYVDTALANVKLLAQSGSTTNVQISYFDKA